MKIFFNASITGKKEFDEHYHRIEDILSDLGHFVITPVFVSTREEINKETREETKTYCDNMHSWIKEADICVFEISYPSTGIGYEIATALGQNKPVILLTSIRGVKMVFHDIDSERLQFLEYDLDDIGKVLKTAVGYAADQQDTRFNFFVSAKHQNYMDWVSKHRKVPRAVFLRELINKSMRENKEYS